MRGSPLVVALYIAAGIGFVAGKTDLDVKIREAMRASQQRLAEINARAIADALESRKLAVPVKAASD